MIMEKWIDNELKINHKFINNNDITDKYYLWDNSNSGRTYTLRLRIYNEYLRLSKNKNTKFKKADCYSRVSILGSEYTLLKINTLDNIELKNKLKNISEDNDKLKKEIEKILGDNNCLKIILNNKDIEYERLKYVDNNNENKIKEVSESLQTHYELKEKELEEKYKEKQIELEKYYVKREQQIANLLLNKLEKEMKDLIVQDI